MKKAHFGFVILVSLTMAILLTSCNPVENETTSASLLIVLDISGTDVDGNSVNFLQSDVLHTDSGSGAKTIIADIATATMTAELVNPLSATGPSPYNAVTVERYVVSFMRADGKSTEGVDVPYSFEGYLSVVVDVGNAVGIPFVIVREVAKAEPPLIGLAEGRDVGVLEVQAKVEFFGKDLTNREVKATGYLTIFFANYDEPPPIEDPEDPGTGTLGLIGSIEGNTPHPQNDFFANYAN